MKKKKLMISVMLAALSMSQSVWGNNLAGTNQEQVVQTVPRETIYKLTAEMKRCGELKSKVWENLKASFKTISNDKEMPAALNKEIIGAVNIMKRGIPYQADENEIINKCLKEAGLEKNPATYKKLQEVPNTVIILYATQDAANIKVHTIDSEKLSECKWDFELYHKMYGSGKYEILKDKLKSDEVLIITCLEPEGIPLNYLTWDNMTYPDMWLIQYQGN